MQEKKPINIEIGQRIKEQREAAGLTQEAFSEMIGLGVKHVSAMERGAVGVSLTTLKTVCKVLAVSSDSILFGNTSSNNINALQNRLERLSPKQYQIAESMMASLLEAFALNETNQSKTED